MTAPSTLQALVARELATPAEPNPAIAAAETLAREIASRHGDSVAAVLFYGACRRDGDPSGLLDLYVLTTAHRAFHRRALPALLNAALPPTVLLCRSEGAQHAPIHAKVAVLSEEQFARRMRPASLDTTLWARFCQPSTLVHAHDEAARRRTERAVGDAVATAALWAARLGPEEATPVAYWRISSNGPTPPNSAPSAGIAPNACSPPSRTGTSARSPSPWAPRPPRRADQSGQLRPGLAHRRRWRRAWALRRACGKALNALRLAKAAFTFEGGADYLAWKIERHSGVALELADWQRRHPLLAAPVLLWRLRRRGAVR